MISPKSYQNRQRLTEKTISKFKIITKFTATSQNGTYGVFNIWFQDME